MKTVKNTFEYFVNVMGIFIIPVLIIVFLFIRILGYITGFEAIVKPGYPEFKN